MIKILLSDHKTFDWYRFDQKLYIRGMFFDNTEDYHENESLKAFGWSANETDFKRQLCAINGTYSVIVNTGEQTFFAVDHNATLPLFYAIKNNDIYISDSVNLIREKLQYNTIDEDKAREFLAAGFITGKNTLFNGIFMLEAGQYAVADETKGMIEVKDYFLHIHSEPNSFLVGEYLKKLDEIVLNVFRRHIKSFKGRPVILFLSGGYDSRLIAVTLKRLGYENVTCFTFGADSLKDVQCAHEVSQNLGYPLVRLEANKKWFMDFQKSELYINSFRNNTYGYSILYVQGLLLAELIESGKIPKDSIIITGNSGDVVEGNDVSPAFVKGAKYNLDQVVKTIIDQHYFLQGIHLRDFPIFKKYVCDVIPVKQEYSVEEAQDVFEFFNWRARQARYVITDVTCYNDSLGLNWRLPLWDDEFVNFWLNVPLELRYERNLYYKYVMHEQLPTANDISSFRKIINLLKHRTPGLISFLYPIIKPLLVRFSYEADIFYFYELVPDKQRSKIYKYTRCYQLSGLSFLARVTYDDIYSKFSKDADQLLDINY